MFSVSFSASTDIHCLLWLNDISIAKVSEEVNRKFPSRNTMVQLQLPTPTLSTTMHIITDID